MSITPPPLKMPPLKPPPLAKLAFLRRLKPSTLAGKSACVTALVLSAILIVIWLLRKFGPESVRLDHAVSVPHMVIELALVVVIPLVLYWGIRRWNQVIEGEYPEIDRAWEAGIEALRAKGVSPSDYPLFLVLGSSSPNVEQGLMDALDTKMSIHGIPDASGVSHALQWYMSSDAIYLFCPGASSLSALMGRWESSKPSGSLRQQVAAAKARAPRPAGESDAGAAPAQKGIAGIPKIQRVEKASASSPQAPSAAPGAPAKVLQKESSMKGGSPPAGSGPAAPDSYLGTIQHHALDSSPPAGAMPASTAPPAGGTPFNMPAMKSPENPVTPPSSPPPKSAASESDNVMRPAPRYQGTISSFDNAGPAVPATPQTAPQSSFSREGTMFPAATPSHSAERTPNEPPETEPPQPERQTTSAAGQSKPAKPAQAAAMPRVSATKKIALPASLDTSDQLPRLQYVCKLLKRSRRPMCGVNGAITLLPFDLSRVGPLQLSAIAQSARGDVSTIQETLGVRCPVTALLVGMEQDKGFGELVRRLQSGLLSRRLGGRFDLRSRPTPEELNTHSDRLCDAFEDWVYRLFSRNDGLEQQRGNRKLYALTCKIRHELKPRLRIVLGQAFGCESDEAATRDEEGAFFFSGCYFAASGALTGQPAFVKGVLQDKLVDEQSKVQWTRKAMARHRSFQLFAIAGWIVCIVLAVILMIRVFG